MKYTLVETNIVRNSNFEFEERDNVARMFVRTHVRYYLGSAHLSC